jgi:hypothetical protein
MTLGNMRELGVRSLSASCADCHHSAILNVEDKPDDIPVKAFEARAVCSHCDGKRIDARPNWLEFAPTKTTR